MCRAYIVAQVARVGKQSLSGDFDGHPCLGSGHRLGKRRPVPTTLSGEGAAEGYRLIKEIEAMQRFCRERDWAAVKGLTKFAEAKLGLPPKDLAQCACLRPAQVHLCSGAQPQLVVPFEPGDDLLHSVQVDDGRVMGTEKRGRVQP